jgi:DinB superfamily
VRWGMMNVTHHATRIAQIRESFDEANGRLLARLREASDQAAESPAADAWSASQIGWHVAAVTTRFAGMISGEVPAAKPVGAGFRERAWTDVVASIPDRLEAPAVTVPPASVRREEAVAALEAAGERMALALETLTPEQGGHMGITHPVVGAISVYQIGEWATAHVIRHNRQAKRALGQG